MTWMMRISVFAILALTFGIRLPAAHAVGVEPPFTIGIDVKLAPQWNWKPSNGDSVSGVCEKDGFAYVVSLRSLVILNVGNPANVTVVSTFPLPNWAYGISVNDGLAYIVMGGGDLLIVNVGDPSNPVQVGEYRGYQSDEYDASIAVQDGYAYLACRSKGLVVLDVSEPDRPVRIGGYNTTGSAEAVQVFGRYACIADGDAGLVVLNVSNPTNPVSMGTYATDGYAGSVALGVSAWRPYVYVADGVGGLRVYDAAIPSNLVPVAVVPTQGSAEGVAVNGRYVGVAEGRSGVSVLDMIDPVHPKLMASQRVAGFAYNVAMCGQSVYVLKGPAGIETYVKQQYPVAFSAVVARGPAGEQGLYLMRTNAMVGAFIPLPVPAGWILRDVDDGVLLFQQGDGGRAGVVLWHLDDKGVPVQDSFKKVADALPGLVVSSVDNCRVLGQFGSQGIVAQFTNDWMPAGRMIIKRSVAGLSLRSLRGDDVLVQTAPNGAGSVWNLAADGTVLNVNTLYSGQFQNVFLRSLDGSLQSVMNVRVLLQVQDGGAAFVAEFDENWEMLSLLPVGGIAQGWMLRALD